MTRCVSLLKLGVVFFAMLVMLACTSSGPATTFYTFDATQPSMEVQNNIGLVGVGPITLPSYLENTAIVSRTNSKALNVSGYHAWAEPLDSAITRAVTSYVSETLNHSKVVAFPWDVRNRPETQITVRFQQLDGVRNESVKLIAAWSAIDISENKVVKSGVVSKEQGLNSNSYSEYVTAIESLLAVLSEELAAHLVQP